MFSKRSAFSFQFSAALAVLALLSGAVLTGQKITGGTSGGGGGGGGATAHYEVRPFWRSDKANACANFLDYYGAGNVAGPWITLSPSGYHNGAVCAWGLGSTDTTTMFWDTYLPAGASLVVAVDSWDAFQCNGNIRMALQVASTTGMIPASGPTFGSAQMSNTVDNGANGSGLQTFSWNVDLSGIALPSGVRVQFSRDHTVSNESGPSTNYGTAGGACSSNANNGGFFAQTARLAITY